MRKGTPFLPLSIFLFISLLGVSYVEKSGYGISFLDPIKTVLVVGIFVCLICAVLIGAAGRAVGATIVRIAALIALCIVLAMLHKSGKITLPVSLSLFLFSHPWIITMLIIFGILLIGALVNLLLSIILKIRIWRIISIVITAVTGGSMAVATLSSAFVYAFHNLMPYIF